MLYSFASLSSNQVCMQCLVQLLLYLTASNWDPVCHALFAAFFLHLKVDSICHATFPAIICDSHLHVVSFCFTQCACALLLIPVGVFVTGSCTGKVCDPACDPGGRR
jgi:membrane-bound metal-dependent hydrolase YbcI (DUF457 family)